MTLRTHLRWPAIIIAALATCAAISALLYLLVPPHPHLIAAVRDQCASLTGNAHEACLAPVTDALTAWMARGLLAGAVLTLAALAALPWWTRRRHDLMPLDDSSAELRAELTALSGPGRTPSWLLSPYKYTEESRAFGPPWHPAIRIDVGLGILFHADRPRFRAIITGELAHLRHRSTGLSYLAAASILTALIALPTAAPDLLPSTAGATAVDPCLIGYWSESPRNEPRLLPDGTTTVITRTGAIWSFTPDGTTTLYPADETIRTTTYAATGTIRWQTQADRGALTLTNPSATATLTDAEGHATPADPATLALPPTYTCTPTRTTTTTDTYAITLHRIGTLPT